MAAVILFVLFTLTCVVGVQAIVTTLGNRSLYASLRTHGVRVRAVLETCAPMSPGRYSSSNNYVHAYPCSFAFTYLGHAYGVEVPDAGYAIAGLPRVGQSFTLVVDPDDPTAASDPYDISHDDDAGTASLVKGAVVVALFGASDVALLASVVVSRRRRRTRGHIPVNRPRRAA